MKIKTVSRKFLAETKKLMSDLKPIPHGREKPLGNTVHQSHGSYWKRAHRDWRVWVGAVLMVIALSVYVLSGDLGWLPGYQRHQAVSGATMH